MKKRTQRPSFLKELERRYGSGRAGGADGGRPQQPSEPSKRSLPRVYPVAPGKKKIRLRTAADKGVIDMTIQQFLTLAISFMLLAWAGSGAVAYGVVELTGGGPAGEVGPPGPEGPAGVQGAPGIQGPPGDDAAMEMIKRLSSLWAVQQASTLQGGAFVELNNPQIGQCVEYIVTGEPNVGVCPGFSAGGR
jgi:hypothetical protein